MRSPVPIPSVDDPAARRLRGKARTIVRALPIIAAAIGRKVGVEVVVGGNSASTDGKRITLPWIEVDDPQFEEVILGFLWHEGGGHIRHTDFVTWNKAQSGLEQKMLNVIEDIRIEAECGREYPGSVDRLKAVSPWLINKGMLNPVTEKSHPGSVVCDFVHHKLRLEVLDETVVAPLYQAAKEVLRAKFPQGAIIRLEALLSQVDELTSTEDCLTLSRAIMKMLKEEEEKERERQEQQKSARGGGQDTDQGEGGGADDQPSDAGSDQDTATDGSGQGQQGDAGGKGDQPDGNGKADQGSGGTQPSQADGQSGQSQDDSQPSNGGAGAGSAQADAIAQALQAGAGDIADTDHGSLVQKAINADVRENGTIGWRTPTGREEGDNPAAGQVRLTGVKDTSNKVRASLNGLVQAHREENMTSATGRRLDYRRLNRIPLGNGNVFTRKVEHENPNTAFHLHVDRSGSMNGSAPNGQRLIDVALDAGMALAAALETIEGVNPGVTAFPGSSSDAAILQRHGERLAKAAGRFTLQPSGGTPMAEGMWFAALQLVQCDEPRKVLGVVTDGSPDNPEKVKDIIARCEAAGIFTFGIGIGCSAVKSLFEEAVVINDVRDLRTALFGIAKKCLMP